MNYYFHLPLFQVSCLEPISGIGGEKLVDGNMSTCLTLQQPQAGARIQTSFSVNQDCRNGLNIQINVNVNDATQCPKLLSIIVVEKPGASCSKLRKCQEIDSLTVEGTGVCRIRCKCADSAHFCRVHVINEIDSTKLDICEIYITM